MYTEWQKLKEENGVIEESNIFKGLFGGKLVDRVQLRESEVIGEIRKNGGLAVIRDTGIISNSISTKSNSVKKNTFFGE